MHPSAAEDFKRFVDKYLDPAKPLRIADVGSYNENGTLRELLPDGAPWEYVGFDIQPGPNVDVVIDSPDPWVYATDNGFPIFDVVVSSQVVEHVRRPWKWIKTLANLCRMGGLIYVSTPNTIIYHPYPIDCWRIWPDGMRELFKEAELEEIECYAEGIDTTGIARKPQ
jgi:SAM-dependent methyltransferase